MRDYLSPTCKLRLNAAAVLCALSYSALAQTAPSSDNTDTPQQVTVTAQKRSELLQSVPMSVTALDAQDLEHMGVERLTDLAREVPGLTVISAGPGQNILIIRGISSTAGTAGTVGYYLDDTPISASSNASLLSARGLIDPSLFDITRVEVLRGPQGTLYGSSSMGGTIKYVTTQPDLNKFSAKVDGGLSFTEGGGLNRLADTALNIPLSDNVAALRISAFYRYEDGFIDRYPIDPNNYLAALPGGARQEDVNTEKTMGARLQLKLRLPDGWLVNSSFYHQDTSLGAPFQIDEPPGSLDNLIQTRLVSEPSYQNTTLSNISVHKSFEGAEFVSSTSYYNRIVDIDEDASKVLYYFFSPTPESYVYPGVMHGEYINREFTEEMRLVSNSDGPFQWIGGLFYHHVNAPLASSIPVPAGYNTAFGTDYDSFYSGARQASVKETAIFGEASYKFAQNWSATVGLRGFRVTQGFAQQGDGVLNGGPSAVSSSSSDSGLNPKFNLSWQATPDVLFYATASKGYRPGGPNNPAPAAVCGSEVATLGLSQSALVEFGADSLWNYEAGAKTSWLGGRLTANGALYTIDWSKVQQEIVLQCGFNITANFGSATSRGGELELAYRPTPQWNLRATGGFTRATLDNDVPGTDAKNGDTLLNVPRWTASAGAEYTAPVSAGYNSYTRFDYGYIGSENALYDRTSPFYRIAGYAQANLRIGLQQARGGPGWSGAFYVDNVFNKIGETDLPTAISADLPTTRRVAVTTPRTTGVMLTCQF
jgi:outer membrane receptor protein involved in Fe transport